MDSFALLWAFSASLALENTGSYRTGATSEPLGAQDGCSGATSEPLGAQDGCSGATLEPLGAQDGCSGTTLEPLGAQDGCSGSTVAPHGAQKRRSGSSSEPLGNAQSLMVLEACIQRGCSKRLPLLPLSSASLGSAPLCSVHGYARGHTSICIYIYTHIYIYTYTYIHT